MICFRTFLIICMCFLVIVAMAEESEESPEYLYAGKTKVVKEYILEDGDTLFMNSKAPRVVEFYSPNCPFCVEYSSAYIQLAKNTKRMYPEIEFFAVSCDSNEQLCEQHDIQMYPSLRLFKADDGPTSMGVATEFDAEDIEKKEDESTPRKIADLLEITSVSVGIAKNKKTPTKSESKNDDDDDDDDDDDTSKSSENEQEDQGTPKPTTSETKNNDDDDTSKSSENEKEDQGTPEPTKSENKHDDDDDTSKSSENEDEDKKGTPKSENKNDDDDDDDDDDDTSNENKEEDQGTPKPTKSENENDDDDDDDTAKSSENEEEDKGTTKSENKNDDDDDSSSSDEVETSNRYSQTLKEQKENYNRKRKGVPRKYIRKDKQGKLIEVASYEEMTKGMKQYTLGTREFQDRKQAINKRIEKNSRKNKNRVQVLKKESLPYKKDMTKPKWLKTAAEKIPLVKKMVKMSEEEELILDATLSLVVSLQSGVLMGIEDVTSKSAMRNWLDLLSVSLPPEWNIHKLIDHIRNNFEYATESRENFQKIVREHPLARKGWSASCKTTRSASGFACGFWKLLHVVTLGVAEQRGGQNLIDSGMMSPNTVVFSPAKAADTIRNFIDKFFNCAPCRKHFIETYDDCKNNRRCKRLTVNENTENPADWKELSIWLWEVHNDVSVRLVGEKISKIYTKGVKNTPTVTDEVSVIWPNINNCVLCFNDNGIWNNGEIFLFLERTYWPDSETDPMTDKLLTFDREGTSGAGVLWLIAFLIIWLVYKSTGKQSYSIHESLIAARILVSQAANRKSRTA